MATEKKQEGPALGIDLGTTYSCVGVWKDDGIEIIANNQGNRTTPSWVAFTETERLVGEAALNQAHRNPNNTIFGSKRLLGRKYEDIYPGSLPYKLIAGQEEKLQIVLNYQGKEKKFFPEDISAIVLSYMRAISEGFMGTTVTKAVITVPAYFNDSQRRATKDAGRIAGLDVMRVINEPTAAAIAYQLKRSPSETTRLKTILVFDLGGGTFDVTILKGSGSHLEVKATGGDTFLGGEDFDNRMVAYLVGEIRKKYNVNLSGNERSLRRLRADCERAKRILSTSTEAMIEVYGLHDGIDFEWNFTRAKFEEINRDLFQTCMDIVRGCMKDASLEATQIDEVVLVGGSSRIPKVQQMLQELCEGKELCKSINPDEAVAYGATVLSTSLAGEGSQRIKDLTLVDVTPLSLGTSIHGGAMFVMIPRNTPIPVQLSRRFVPMYDNQTSILFDIYEGERSMVVDNNFLGEFRLKGLPPNRRCDDVSIKVIFELDANGILFVSAEDLNSGARNQTTILDKRKVSSKEIEKMVQEARSHRSQDEKCMEKAMSKAKLKKFLDNATFRLENKNLDIVRMIQMKKKLMEMSTWLEENQDLEATVYDEKERKLKDDWENIIGI